MYFAFACLDWHLEVLLVAAGQMCFGGSWSGWRSLIFRVNASNCDFYGSIWKKDSWAGSTHETGRQDIFKCRWELKSIPNAGDSRDSKLEIESLFILNVHFNITFIYHSVKKTKIAQLTWNNYHVGHFRGKQKQKLEVLLSSSSLSS